MHLSLNWLNDHVDLAGIAPEQIAEQLTLKSALIEGYTDQRAALEGVVVGEVLESGPHPGADRLSLCKVDPGNGTPASVVCGAPNVAVGQKIVYAPVGVRLPNGLKLKAAKIRGERSEGMICAEDEIGLGPEHDGIIVLPSGLEPGMPVGEVPGLADVLFEIDNKSVTHRADLWGHRGFARELAAIFGRELKALPLHEGLAPGEDGPSITLEPDCGCPLYAGLVIEDRPSRSPDWMRYRLVGCGVRPLNLLVDLSNYVMLELGQPTHPFDRDRLAGDRIVVRRARSEEVIETLDGESRALRTDDLLIADAEGGVALAGIMGGANTEVSDETVRVFLESASFDPVAVRRTSSRLGLRSEALSRFEKGLDPDLVEVALRRYAALLATLRPEAVIASSYRVAGSAAAPERVISLTAAHVGRHLGMPVENAEIRSTLESVGLGVETVEDGSFRVSIPSWRATRDLTIPEDLIEEVGRLVGYDRVPAKISDGALRLGERAPALVVEDVLRDALCGMGFTEMMGYSMAFDNVLERAGWPTEVALPRLANPLQHDATRLRPSPAPGMLARLEAWLRHEPEARVLEVGRGYGLGPDGQVSESHQVVALVASREARDARDVVRELAGLAQAGMAALGLAPGALCTFEPDAETPWFHPRRSACLMAADGEAALGRLGAVAPDVLSAFDVQGAAGLLVLDVDALVAQPAPGSRYEPVSRFPAATIDLAFVLPYDLEADRLAASMRTAGPKVLRRVEAFDVYRGKPLADEERSVAFHLVFQATDRTLKDAEVEKARARIVAAAEKLGARLR
jgi:phenylalanyl-tRNA synthetase beta chain